MLCVVSAENGTRVEEEDMYEETSYSRAIGGIGGGLGRGLRESADSAGCVISARALTTLMSVMGGLTALLAFVSAALLWRQCRERSSKEHQSPQSAASVPYDRYPTRHHQPRSSSRPRHHTRR